MKLKELLALVEKAREECDVVHHDEKDWEQRMRISRVHVSLLDAEHQLRLAIIHAKSE